MGFTLMVPLSMVCASNGFDGSNLALLYSVPLTSNFWPLNVQCRFEAIRGAVALACDSVAAPVISPPFPDVTLSDFVALLNLGAGAVVTRAPSERKSPLPPRTATTSVTSRLSWARWPGIATSMPSANAPEPALALAQLLKAHGACWQFPSAVSVLVPVNFRWLLLSFSPFRPVL